MTGNRPRGALSRSRGTSTAPSHFHAVPARLRTAGQVAAFLHWDIVVRQRLGKGFGACLVGGGVFGGIRNFGELLFGAQNGSGVGKPLSRCWMLLFEPLDDVQNEVQQNPRQQIAKHHAHCPSTCIGMHRAIEHSPVELASFHFSKPLRCSHRSTRLDWNSPQAALCSRLTPWQWSFRTPSRQQRV